MIFKDFTLDELKKMRKSIGLQLAAGKLNWSYNGQSVTFSNPSEMRKTARDIQTAITRLEAAALGYQPIDGNSTRVSRPLAG